MRIYRRKLQYRFDMIVPDNVSAYVNRRSRIFQHGKSDRSYKESKHLHSTNTVSKTVKCCRLTTRTNARAMHSKDASNSKSTKRKDFVSAKAC